MAPKAKAAKNQVTTISKMATPTQARIERHRPNWPALTPLIPASDLVLNPLLPDQVLTISRFWTSSLCKTYINFLSSLPMTTTPEKPKRGDAVRVNDRFQVDDSEFAERLWSCTALKQIVERSVVHGVEMDEAARAKLWGGEVLGLNSNIRIYRYTPGQFFDRHFDDSNTIIFPCSRSPSPIPARTTWTFLLYLTSPATGCHGGETVFYPEAPSKREAAPSPVVAGAGGGHGTPAPAREGVLTA